MFNFIILSFIVLLLDLIYFRVYGSYFKKVVNNVQKSKLVPRYSFYTLSYLDLILTIKYFVIYKNLNYYETFFLGLYIYCIYEFTNYTIYKNWELKMVVVDSLWGGILFLLTKYIYSLFF